MTKLWKSYGTIYPLYGSPTQLSAMLYSVTTTNSVCVWQIKYRTIFLLDLSSTSLAKKCCLSLSHGTFICLYTRWYISQMLYGFSQVVQTQNKYSSYLMSIYIFIYMFYLFEMEHISQMIHYFLNSFWNILNYKNIFFFVKKTKLQNNNHSWLFIRH